MLPVVYLTLLVTAVYCQPRREADLEHRTDDRTRRPFGLRPFCDETATIETTVTVSTAETATSTEYIFVVPTEWPPRWENVPFGPSHTPWPGPSNNSPPGPPSPEEQWDGWQKFPAGWTSDAGSGGSQSEGQGGTPQPRPLPMESYQRWPPLPESASTIDINLLGSTKPLPPSGSVDALLPSGSTKPLPTSESSRDRPTSGWISSVSNSGLTSALSTSVSTTHPPSSVSTSVSATSQTSSTTTPAKSPIPWPDHTVTGYYGSGQADIFPPKNIPWQYLTHLCYAFAKTSGEESNFTLQYDAALLLDLSQEATAHGVTMVLSIGGYGEGGQYFSQAVATNKTRADFVSSIVDVVTEYKLGGVDLDWEFVGQLADVVDDPDHDAANYLSLLIALRNAMPDVEISAAVPMFLFQETEAPGGKLVPVDMRPYVDYFDRLYLMCYDLWNDGDVSGGSNGALGPTQGATNHDGQKLGVGGVQTWSEAGFPMEKLVYGVPFYGTGYILTSNSNPASTGLYSPTVGKSPGDNGEKPDKPKDNTGFWRWRNLKSQNVVQEQPDGSYAAGPGWTYGYDLSTQTPFVYNNLSAAVPQIISYDDPSSLLLKREYARQKGMSGMMFWLMHADTDNGELTKLLT